MRRCNKPQKLSRRSLAVWELRRDGAAGEPDPCVSLHVAPLVRQFDDTVKSRYLLRHLPSGGSSSGQLRIFARFPSYGVKLRVSLCPADPIPSYSYETGPIPCDALCRKQSGQARSAPLPCPIEVRSRVSSAPRYVSRARGRPAIPSAAGARLP